MIIISSYMLEANNYIIYEFRRLKLQIYLKNYKVRHFVKNCNEIMEFRLIYNHI